MLTAGVDIGSTMTKVLILSDGREISREITETGTEHRTQAHLVMERALEQVKLSINDLDYIVGTGYGRLNIPFADKQITEITCHGRGVAALFPEAKTVIEIGGQDCKAIRLEANKVVDFAMNEKCAAGTGRFLQLVADMLELTLPEMNQMAMAARETVPISNYCAIFAQQEIIASLSMGIAPDAILAGLFDSFARRLIKLAQPIGVKPAVVLTGGGSKHLALKNAVETVLGYPVCVPEEPFLTGALGAALLAADRAIKEGTQKGCRKLEPACVCGMKAENGGDVKCQM